MQTPVLSKKQQKKSLSAKKPKKETIRNILAKPYENFWPELSNSDNELLIKTLTDNLPKLQNEKTNVPYEKIKNVPKNERKTIREKVLNNPKLPKIQGETDCIVLGVNSVSTALQNHQIGAILIASDVQPRLFVQHIIDQAVLFSIPTLVVQNLRNTLKNSCGIASSTFGLANIPTLTQKTQTIYKTITNLAKKYPVPTAHINYNRRIDLNSPQIIEISDSDMSKSLISLSSDISDKEDTNIEDDTITFPFLHRTDKNKRIFTIQPTKTTTTSETFLTLSSSGGAEKNEEHIYKALKVKRIQADKNRNVRKMGQFKRKKK